MIFLSTGGVSDQPAWKTSKLFENQGIESIELSGGLPDRNHLEKLKSLSERLTFQIHNYFPPPEEPFVFNLASVDREIGQTSLRHVETAMHWAIELGRPIYSFHGGFLLDPKVNELGKRIGNRGLFNRIDAMHLFLERVNLLANRASELGVELLIENNVLSANNAIEFKDPPFLLLTDDECVELMQQTPNNVNLLIDVAHLKVSARSLNFDKINFLKRCDQWIRAYHLSDNNGRQDSNEPVDNNSWFWPYLKRDLDYYSLEVYNKTPVELAQQYELAKKCLER